MPSVYLLLLGLCGFGLAYRFYGAFLAARVTALDASRETPAFTHRDGKDYHPTNRWILFGHHFAAIAGAGPLVGPVLAAQYGYLPGAIWILIGAIFAGAVHDYIILFASVRNRGESISRIAERYLGKTAGWCAAFATLFIIIVALAGLAMVVINALGESPWGVFTIACSIPIALLMGQWLYRIRPGRVAEASAIGVLLLLLAVVAGDPISRSSIASWFTLTKSQLEIALPTYGFIAAVLPVWMLLCPRDYLSTYMKLGTVGLLAIGIFVVNPHLAIPPTTEYLSGGGPVVPGPVWPYVCLTIACGAISGFHALIGSGTTPKMISNERDVLPIGYGAMLVEGFVGLMALVAACTLLPEHYFTINADPAKYQASAQTLEQVSRIAQEVGEGTLVGRTGGSVTLAVGMAQIFRNLPGMGAMMSYWYHFAIMFEALFILTTIDTGTRVARFILQEIAGRAYAPLKSGTWLPGVILTSFLVSFGWFILVRGGTVATIWPMFGIANQLLAVVALAVGTSYILRHAAKKTYALTTFLPFTFLAVTVFASGIQFSQKMLLGAQPDYLKGLLAVMMMILAVVICWECARNWRQLLCGNCAPLPEIDSDQDLLRLAEGTEIAD
ncbi:MAG: carbon starvation protein A [Armatimonadetes bacterium]|nr:carbon starvation protein A [Armatimonadota bacterium]